MSPQCKNPQRNLPIGILGSLAVCAVLYAGVSLVLTGLVPVRSLAPCLWRAPSFGFRNDGCTRSVCAHRSSRLFHQAACTFLCPVRCLAGCLPQDLSCVFAAMVTNHTRTPPKRRGAPDGPCPWRAVPLAGRRRASSIRRPRWCPRSRARAWRGSSWWAHAPFVSQG